MNRYFGRVSTTWLILIGSTVSTLSLVSFQSACSARSHQPVGTLAATGQLNPNPGAEPQSEDGQWPMAAKNYQNTRYSGLAEINASNVGSMKVAWTFSTGVDRGQEAA